MAIDQSSPAPAIVLQPPAPAASAESGTATTEFWATQVSSLVMAVILVLSVFGIIHWTESQKAAVIGLLAVAIAVAQGFYAMSRGLRKQGTPG